jgi:PPM family protein phosphatase
MAMRSAFRTDQGVVRENNEDFVLADEANGIFILADGMGGGPAGEVASELAATTSHDLLLRELAGRHGEVTGRLLADALAAAHSAVAKRALKDLSLTGMGTTLEIVVVRGAEAVVCHVGDSRIYLYRQGTLRQLTNDDNYAAVYARAQNIPPERVPSGYRHILTQAVGVSDELIPEVLTVAFKPEDLLLICSDGLNAALSDREIRQIVAEKGRDLDAAVEGLVTAANDKGAPDNVSVLLVEPLSTAAAEPLLLPGGTR